MMNFTITLKADDLEVAIEKAQHGLEIRCPGSIGIDYSVEEIEEGESPDEDEDE